MCDSSSDQIRVRLKNDYQEWMHELDSIPSRNLSKPQLIYIFDSLAIQLKDYERKLSSMALSLAPYDMKNCVKDLKEMESRLGKDRSVFIPQKKFGFKGRVKKSSAHGGECTSAVPESITAQVVASGQRNEQPGLRNRSDEHVTVEKSNIEGGDYVLSGLMNCTVDIPSSSTALQLSNLRDCVIHAGPSAGSVFVEDCRGCTLHLACHQVSVECFSIDSRLVLRY